MTNAGWLICCLALASEPDLITIESALLKVAQQAEVPARDEGLLVEILVREGQLVKAGEPLANLDDVEAKLTRQKAAIDLQRANRLAGNDIKLRQARVELELATSEMKRAMAAEKKLPASVSESEFDQLRSKGRRAVLDLEQAQFDLDAAKLAVALFENELQTAEERLLRRRIVAPISGVVVNIPKRPGEWVEPGQLVVKIHGTEKLRVEFFLDAGRGTAELIGRTIRFTLPSGPAASAPAAAEVCTGQISVVSPEVDPLSGQVRVWAEIDNRNGRMRPGLTGSLAIPP